MQALVRRRHQLSDTGLEVFFAGHSSLYLTFKSPGERDAVAGACHLLPFQAACAQGCVHGGLITSWLQYQSQPSLLTCCAGFIEQASGLQLSQRGSRARWRRDWQQGRVSSFDYLLFLNRHAARRMLDGTWASA